MRILHLFRTYFPDSYGGVEQFIYQLARGCAQRGHTVEVLSLSRDRTQKLTKLDGHNAHHAHLDFEIASNGFSLSVFAKFSELARDADVVHYHFPWPFTDVVHFVARTGKPTVLTYHSDIVRHGAPADLAEVLPATDDEISRQRRSDRGYLAELSCHQHHPQPVPGKNQRYSDRPGSGGLA